MSGQDQAQQGTLHVDGIKNVVAADFSQIEWMPEWAVSPAFQWVLSVVGVVGSGIIGVALAPLLLGSAPIVVEVLAKQCSSGGSGAQEACAALQVNQGSPWAALACGVLLVATYILAMWWTTTRKRRS
jgi:hypothetical protein